MRDIIHVCGLIRPILRSQHHRRSQKLITPCHISLKSFLVSKKSFYFAIHSLWFPTLSVKRFKWHQACPREEFQRLSYVIQQQKSSASRALHLAQNWLLLTLMMNEENFSNSCYVQQQSSLGPSVQVQLSITGKKDIRRGEINSLLCHSCYKKYRSTDWGFEVTPAHVQWLIILSSPNISRSTQLTTKSINCSVLCLQLPRTAVCRSQVILDLNPFVEPMPVLVSSHEHAAFDFHLVSGYARVECLRTRMKLILREKMMVLTYSGEKLPLWGKTSKGWTAKVFRLTETGKSSCVIYIETWYLASRVVLTYLGEKPKKIERPWYIKLTEEESNSCEVYIRLSFSTSTISKRLLPSPDLAYSSHLSSSKRSPTDLLVEPFLHSYIPHMERLSSLNSSEVNLFDGRVSKDSLLLTPLSTPSSPLSTYGKPWQSRHQSLYHLNPCLGLHGESVNARH